MKKAQYQAQRNKLLAEAQQLCDDGECTEAEAKLEAVTKLDANWDKEAEVRANMEALNSTRQYTDFVEDNTAINADEPQLSVEDEYKQAFFNVIRGQNISDREQTAINNYNSNYNRSFTNFVHSTANTALVIPETTEQKIWARAEEGYALYGDAKKYKVDGKLTLIKHTGIEEGDAKWYTEITATEDEKNTYETLELDGRELSKSITISWKLKKMAISDFENHLIRELGSRMAVALGTSASVGKGKNATSPEPEGVITAITAETSTPQQVTYNEAQMKYSDLTSALSKIHSSYISAAAIYASNETVWSVLANITDTTGQPMFIADTENGNIGRILGIPVKKDAGITKGWVIIGAPSEGLAYNIIEGVSITQEEHNKARTTDYTAYSIVDGGVLDTKAFAVLKPVKAG